ncbi:hypothetical protein A3860_22665 [Niastella vici]|uniref:Secretion system C-terminal sorting domain-containing protein n=1 Tax=Niastella vici TaxID=1703345 RepID=A0A1V9FZS6_9BACT|nr:T9SS type A sorting domain-containing protein [Niastella vici]OQP63746.1 hypothetical protein A3860_22665 [Niastella vici]
MKTLSSSHLTACCKMPGFITVLLFISSHEARAQFPVTAVSTHTVNATTSLTYSGTGATGNASSGFAGNSYTYKFGTAVQTTNNNVIIDSFTANSLVYHYEPASSYVKFRRVNNATATGNRKSFRIEQTGGAVNAGGTASLLPDYDDSLERVYTQRLINVGIDNLFQNDVATNNNNIERMDVIFPNGIKATDNTKAGFGVFEWGTAGGHDPFVIAAIKTLDASQNPSSYYTADSVGPSYYGSGIIGNANYLIMRQNDGETRMLLEGNNTGAAQNRDGVFLRFSDLSVPSNTMIYGYSIFAPDTKRTPVTNLVDYTNGTNFPTTTNLSGGGLDPLAVTGLWVINSSFVVLAELIDGVQSTVVNDQVKLSWTLQNTSDLAEQVVEKSTDGINYTFMQQVAIQATAQQTAIDTRPANGKNYYRLKLVLKNGPVLYSSISWATMKTTPELVMDVYPNPVKNKLVNLDLGGLTNSNYTLLLLDMMGHPLLRQSITGQQTLHTSVSLPGYLRSGTYLLQLTNQLGDKVAERQLIVQ